MDRYIDILNREIQPVLQSHGGQAEITDVKDGTIIIKLQGACAGCPSADSETKNFIEKVFTVACPEISRVELYQPVSEELLDYARKILFNKKE